MKHSVIIQRNETNLYILTWKHSQDILNQKKKKKSSRTCNFPITHVKVGKDKTTYSYISHIYPLI